MLTISWMIRTASVLLCLGDIIKSCENEFRLRKNTKK